MTFALTRSLNSPRDSKEPGLPRSLRVTEAVGPGLEKSHVERWAVKLEFVGAAKGIKPLGEAETGGVISYFKGKPEDWRTGIPTYSRLIYPDLWPGIDLVYYGTVDRLKYEFIVHPGADPSDVRLAYRGAESVIIDEAGRLRAVDSGGRLF